MNSKKKILITGATGFIGQHLLDELVGEYETIRIITRNANPVFRVQKSALEIIQGTISDSETIRKAFAGIDTVVHLAAELRDQNQMIFSNENAIRLMVEEGKISSVTKFIHLSSVGVTGAKYNSSQLVITENTSCNPQNAYEKSKFISEEILRNSFWNEKKQLIILRPTNVYGDHHPREALLNLFRHVKNGKTIYATKESQVNYLYAKDLTSMIRHAMDHEMQHNCYQVGQSIKFAEFINEIAKAENVDSPLRNISLAGLKLASAFAIFSPALRARLRSLSNAVVYSDESLKKEFQYPFGYSKGLQKTIEYYNQKEKLA